MVHAESAFEGHGLGEHGPFAGSAGSAGGSCAAPGSGTKENPLEQGGPGYDASDEFAGGGAEQAQNRVLRADGTVGTGEDRARKRENASPVGELLARSFREGGHGASGVAEASSGRDEELKDGRRADNGSSFDTMYLPSADPHFLPLEPAKSPGNPGAVFRGGGATVLVETILNDWNPKPSSSRHITRATIWTLP